MLFILLENVRSAYNVGSAFRTADCAGIEGVFLTGYTAHPPHKKLAKTALDSQENLPWVHASDGVELVRALKRGRLPEGVLLGDKWRYDGVDWADFEVVAFETAPAAEELYRTELPENAIFLFGHEVEGISDALLALADRRVVIPMFGHKASLNVASSLAVGMYEWVRQWRF